MREKSLKMLGLARRARLLEVGEEPVGIACRGSHARLLLIAKDAADHTFRRARSFCRTGKPPYLCVPFTKDELGSALGCNACALCCFTDPAFAKAFLETLNEGECPPEILAELTRQTQRVQKRRQEEKAHRNNVKHGKK
ncbi:MAG: 50S ribosomal protein L7 [Oscillospiraceae bacterium]|nr:50S ribosomal protein L7 [Oscillospiraceae bacterium]